MKTVFLVAASLLAVPAGASQDSNMADRCKAMDVLMGVHKAAPVKPEQSPKAILLPKAQIESTGPAVLIPNCQDEGKERRKKDDYPLA